MGGVHRVDVGAKYQRASAPKDGVRTRVSQFRLGLSIYAGKTNPASRAANAPESETDRPNEAGLRENANANLTPNEAGLRLGLISAHNSGMGCLQFRESAGLPTRCYRQVARVGGVCCCGI